MNSFSKKLWIFGAGVYAIVTFCTMNIPFFWDTILTSTIAQWFYDEGIQNAIPPLTWDAGHPTLFQIYLSSVWKIFGQSLTVSHWAMYPFLIWMLGAFLYLLQTLKVSKNAQIFGLLCVLIHPYILTQSTLISYDILQIAFFLTAFIGILQQRSSFIFVGIALLSACSVRGQILSALLLLSYFMLYYRQGAKVILTIILSILPAILWNVYHFQQTGWMLSTPSESWENHRSIASFSQIVKNIFGVSRSFMDYGAAALSLTFLVSLRHFKTLKEVSSHKKFIFIFLIVYLGSMCVMLLLNNPIGHRYFMILHVGMILWLCIIWEKLQWKKMIVAGTFICFASGHFWLYPSPISNGWDVTLQYISYEKNRAELHQYIQDQQIKTSDIASAFPLFCSLQQTDLVKGERMLDISEQETLNSDYIAFSPVCNDMKHIDKEQLENKHQLIKVFGKGMTRVELYGKK